MHQQSGASGETSTGRRLIMPATASESPCSVTLELGGRSNIFFEDVMREDDAFFDKALEALPCLP